MTDSTFYDPSKDRRQNPSLDEFDRRLGALESISNDLVQTDRELSKEVKELTLAMRDLANTTNLIHRYIERQDNLTARLHQLEVKTSNQDVMLSAIKVIGVAVVVALIGLTVPNVISGASGATIAPLVQEIDQ